MFDFIIKKLSVYTRVYVYMYTCIYTRCLQKYALILIVNNFIQDNGTYKVKQTLDFS